MDELDKKILRLLQLDSRNSFTKIAHEIGVSTATVSDRVKRLTEKGIIHGYTTILNTAKLGLVTLITKIKTRPGIRIEDVGKGIAEMEECCSIYHITGNFDLLVISKCIGYENCRTIIEKIKDIEGIDSVDAELVLKTLKEELKVEL